MTNLAEILNKLKAAFPLYRFSIRKGPFQKFISVSNNRKIIFTIWVDKRSGYKEVLDEINLFDSDWFELSLKTRLFHWSKYRRLPRNLSPRWIIEKIEMNSGERQVLKEKLELFLQNLHLV